MITPQYRRLLQTECWKCTVGARAYVCVCVSERERVVGKKLASGGLTVPLLLEVPLNVGIEESNVHLYGCGHDPAREKFKNIYILPNLLWVPAEDEAHRAIHTMESINNFRGAHLFTSEQPSCCAAAFPRSFLWRPQHNTLSCVRLDLQQSAK